jgi:hypothetical protein
MDLLESSRQARIHTQRGTELKHCPNSACPGIEKFNAVSEFNDTALACSDCGGRLVTGPAPDLADLEDHPEVAEETVTDLVPVFITQGEAELRLAESVLNQHSIPYLARGEQIQDLFGLGRLTAVNPITGPVEIHVALDKAEVARELLAATLEKDSGQE